MALVFTASTSTSSPSLRLVTRIAMSLSAALIFTSTVVTPPAFVRFATSADSKMGSFFSSKMVVHLATFVIVVANARGETPGRNAFASVAAVPSSGVTVLEV